jgi:predicted phage tail protein
MNTATLASPKQRKAKTTPKLITVRRITNPFEPLRAVEVEHWVWKKRKVLATYLPAGLAADHVVSRNGAVVDPKDLKKTFLDPDDYVVLCPIPRGGSGGKGIFRIVAMVAVAVASAYTGGAAAAAYGSAMGVSATSGAALAAGAIAATAVTVAGSMLVNAILPPVTATNRGSSLSNSSSYGADGAKNTSTEGIAVPVSYGDYRMAGNIIGLYTEQNVSGTDASNNGNNQILYMLINAGEGPIASISDILINDRPAEEFLDVTTQTRLGYGVQSPIDWFSKVITPVNKNVKLPAKGDFITVSTVEECEQFRLDFTCPSGLYSLNTKDGSFNANSVALDIEYRVLGSNAPWTQMQSTKTAYSTLLVKPSLNLGVVTALIVSNEDGSAASDADRAAAMDKYGIYIGKAWPFDSVNDYGSSIATTVTMTASRQVPSGDLVITDNLRATVRRSFTSPQIAMAKYEIRVRRNPNYSVQTVNNQTNQIRNVFPTDSSDNAQSDTYLTDLNEIKFDGVAYNHTALLALRIQMDDQLSGVPSVSFMRGGNLVKVMTRTNGVVMTSVLPSKNPAWIWYDMATNPIYGAGLAEARIDLDSVFAWAAFCDAQGLTWNGPLDQIQNFWDASALVLRVGHAQVIQVGTRYYVATEAEAEPVMMFGMGNIIADSFKMNWLGMKDRATEIDITYFDKTDNNRSKTVKVTDSSLALTGASQNVSAITLFGVDDMQTAYKEGAFQLNLNRLLTQSVEFDAPLEAIACTPGDVVLVQHNMPNWAYSGRLEAGSTTDTLVLDQAVTMEAGKQYKALLLTNFVERARARIASISGNFVQLVGGVNIKNRINRIRGTNGVETGITAMVPDGVYVDNVAGLVVGDDATLFDTDVVTDVDVSVRVGETTTLSLATPLNYAPAQFTVFMFGESAKVRKPFRVTAITLATDTANRNIKALEYNPAVYDLSAYSDVINSLMPPLLPPEQAAIGQVTALSVYEETYVTGTQILSDVRVAWGGPQVGSYAGADIYVSVNGGPMNKYDTVRAATSYVVPGTAAGDALVVRVVAYDLWGKRASYDKAPTASYKVIGQVGAIDVAHVSGANFIWAGRDCKIFWNYNATTSSFEFGSEPNGADGGARDPHFQDYEIRVYDHDHKPLRTEHTTDNSYVYSFEKNVADGTHRRLTFEISVRDIFNNIGKPAVLDAYNPPPQVTSVGVNPAYDRAQVNFQHTDDADYAGAQVYLRQNGDVILGTDVPVYDGPDLQVLLTNLMFNADYNFVIVPYDAFGLDETIPSQQFHFRTPFLDVEAIADGVLKDSKLTPLLQTRLDLIDAPASILGSVNERLSTAKTEITSVQSSQATAISALSTKVDTVSAKTDSNAALITSEQTARTDADSALGTRIDVVAASVGPGVIAAIQTEQIARATADSALGSRIDTVEVGVGDANAQVRGEATARASADSALGTRIDTVVASVGQANALIQQETQARADADGAAASQIGSLQTQVGNNYAMIQSAYSSINGLSAQYTVKIDNNGYVSGFGLASYPVNGGIVSEFAVRADTFSVQLPGYSGVRPFTIGAVYGVPQVIVSSALIGDASIVTAKIGDLQVNTFKLAGNSVSVPSYIGGNGGASGISNGQLIGPVGSMTLSFADAASIVAFLSWQAQNSSNDSTNSRVQIRVDGNPFVDSDNSCQAGFATSFATSGKTNVSAGTHTFTVYVGNTWPRGNWNLAAWGMTILGVMR